MALDSQVIWGKDVADAIKALGVVAGVPVDDTKLEQMWAAIVGEHRTQMTTKMQAAGTTAVTSGSSAGSYASVIPAGGHT